MVKKYLVLVGVAALFLSGCNHLSIQNFERSPYSLVSNNKSYVVLLNSLDELSSNPVLEEYSKKNHEFKVALKSTCTPNQKALLTSFIPIAASMGKLIFDRQMDKNSREIEKLKKAAQSTYSSKVILPSNEFNKYLCVVLYRYEENNKSIGLISVLELKNKGEGFIIAPTYIKANNTVAITKKPEEGKSAKVNVSIAVSVKAIGTENNGLPQLTSIGEGVTTVINIDVGPKEKAACGDGCDSSDLVPYLKNSEKITSVSFSVTETGKIGIDLDERLAEAKALKEAIGPALKDSLKEYLTED